MSRETRIYRYLTANQGWQPRDKIMHWAGFASPKRYPVIAYVEFQNDVIRLNSALARSGRHVVRRSREIEDYRIESIAVQAA